ncbi:Methuselah-like protein 10, partial [Operophtera brumata]
MLPKLVFISLILKVSCDDFQKIETRSPNLCKTNCVNKCCPIGMVYSKLKISSKEKKVGMCVPMKVNDTDLLLGQKHFLYHTVFLNDNTEYTKDRGESVFLKDKFRIISGINCGTKPRNYYRSHRPFYILEITYAAEVPAPGAFIWRSKYGYLCRPCSDINSVDITNGDAFRDGTVFKDGVTYLPKYVFAKNVSGEMKTFGCLCEVKNCFRKCCPIGSVMHIKSKSCVPEPETDELLNKGLDLHFFSSFKKNVGVASSYFAMVHGLPGCPIYREIEKWYIQG